MLIVEHTRKWMQQPTTQGFWWCRVKPSEEPQVCKIATTEHDFPLNPETSRIYFLNSYYAQDSSALADFLKENTAAQYQKVRSYND